MNRRSTGMTRQAPYELQRQAVRPEVPWLGLGRHLKRSQTGSSEDLLFMEMCPEDLAPRLEEGPAVPPPLSSSRPDGAQLEVAVPPLKLGWAMAAQTQSMPALAAPHEDD